MDILNKMITGGPAVYYDPGFRVMMEDHLTYLRNLTNNEIIEIEPGIAYKYEGDYYGMLMHHGILPEYHWSIMRMNGYMSPQDDRGEQSSFMNSPVSALNRISSTYRSHSTLR